MSIQWVAWVLEHSPTTGSDRLALISIANHAGATGAAFPGVATIAKEAGLSVRRTHDAIRRLEESGAISRMVNAGVGDPDKPYRTDRRPNLYRIHRSHGEDTSSPPTVANGEDTSDVTGRTVATPTGRTKCPTKPSVEPSLEPKALVPAAAETPEADLCRYLAERVAAHRGSPLPKHSSATWLEPMRLLLARGPTSWATPAPVPADRVRRAIDVTFTRLADRNTRGFCWADQIRSAAALRDKWDELYAAAARPPPAAHPATKVEQTMAVAARLAARHGGTQPIDLFSRKEISQ